MVDGVRNAGVLRNALVGIVANAFRTAELNGNVLEQSVAADGVEDVGLAFGVKVDDLCVAAAFVVEYAVVVPSVFVVADEQTVRVGAQSGLTRAAQTEEYGGVFACRSVLAEQCMEAMPRSGLK